MKFVYKFIQFFVDIIDQVMWQGGPFWGRPLCGRFCTKAALWAVLYEGRFVGGFAYEGRFVGGFVPKAALWAVLYEGRFVGGFVRRPLCGRFCTKAALWAVLYKGRFVGGFVRRPLCGRFCTKAALWAVYLTHSNLIYYITISYVYI